MTQFIKFYFTSSMLNMFRTLIHPSSGACELFYFITTLVVCSCFDVCWSFGVAGWDGIRVAGFVYIYIYIYIVLWRCGPSRAIASSFLTFLEHTQRRTTFGRTPLVKWWPRRIDSAWQQTPLIRDEHPCTQRSSNPQSQHASGLWPTP